jgi:hypothetical protein
MKVTIKNASMGNNSLFEEIQMDLDSSTLVSDVKDLIRKKINSNSKMKLVHIGK